MQRAYARLAAVLPDAPPGLHLVRSVRLTYGAHEVLVEMPAVAGREAADAEVTSGGSVLDAVAASIVWLARKGVVYVDLRGPNVVIDAGGDPWLVDFDDCLAVRESVDTLASFTRHLAASPGADRKATFASRLAGGFLPAVKDALTAAFAAAEEA
jgi:Ser/Thr protein kinase RdoA (MazF antagonist)